MKTLIKLQDYLKTGRHAPAESTQLLRDCSEKLAQLDQCLSEIRHQSRAVGNELALRRQLDKINSLAAEAMR